MKEHTRKPYCLITGASSGLGRELAYLYAKNCTHLILVARNKEALNQLAEELQNHHGIAVLPIALDLENPGAIEQLLARIQTEKINVTTLINNAGFGDFGACDSRPLAIFSRMIQLNCQSLAALTWHFANEMKERGSGTIVNIASTAAFQPIPFMAVYAATKAFVLSFSDAIHEELQESGIHVVTVCPGAFRSNFAATAGLLKSKLFNELIPDSEWVAAYTFKKIQQHKRLIIPGMLNKLGVIIERFVPRNILIQFIGRYIQPR